MYYLGPNYSGSEVLWRNDANVFRRFSSFAIAVVVTSRASSFEYTMSVHAGAEKNVYYCSIYWNTPNHHQSIANAVPRVQNEPYPCPTPSLHLHWDPTTFNSAAFNSVHVFLRLFVLDLFQINQSNVDFVPLFSSFKSFTRLSVLTYADV